VFYFGAVRRSRNSILHLPVLQATGGGHRAIPRTHKAQILGKIFQTIKVLFSYTLNPMKVILYHKPTCGTCQKVLKALHNKGVEIHAVEYLKTPPSETELAAILKKLKMEPEELARRKEPLFEEKFAGKSLSRSQWLKVLHENPVLIERPIVVMGDRAVVARPPERLAELFK
jgi:arsenate reductase